MDVCVLLEVIQVMVLRFLESDLTGWHAEQNILSLHCCCVLFSGPKDSPLTLTSGVTAVAATTVLFEEHDLLMSCPTTGLTTVNARTVHVRASTLVFPKHDTEAASIL